MKNSILALSVMAVVSSCQKTEQAPVAEVYTCTNCVTAPEARADQDHSSAGVYKGVIMGRNTGIVKLYFHHAGTEEEIQVAYNGMNTVLNTEYMAAWLPGLPIKNVPFSGSLQGQNVQAMFSVDSLGTNPAFIIGMPGENMQYVVYKETSGILTKGFEGSFEGDRQGTVSMAVHGNDFTVAITNKTDIFTGTITGNKISGLHEGMEILGTIDGDVASGTWRDQYNRLQGKWTAKRTL